MPGMNFQTRSSILYNLVSYLKKLKNTAQMPDHYLKDYPSSFSFEPVAVIKTPAATLAISNEVSDHLLNQLVKAVSHA